MFSVKIPSKLSAATRLSPSSTGPPNHRPCMSVSFVQALSPPTLMTHTSPPNFLLKKIKDRKKKKMAALTRGKLLVTITIVEITTVPLRLIQRSSRRTSHNLQRSNRNITLSNPPTLYMETDGNKKLIEEHPAPPLPPPTSPTPSSPTQPQEDV